MTSLILLKSKLHGATVTEVAREYEGSLTVSRDLMAAVKLRPYEKILVANLNNGNRFETYVIPGPENSGTICLNGATSFLGEIGHRVIIFSFCVVPESEAAAHRPLVIVVGKDNKPVGGLRPT